MNPYTGFPILAGFLAGCAYVAYVACWRWRLIRAQTRAYELQTKRDRLIAEAERLIELAEEQLARTGKGTSGDELRADFYAGKWPELKSDAPARKPAH